MKYLPLVALLLLLFMGACARGQLAMDGRITYVLAGKMHEFDLRAQRNATLAAPPDTSYYTISVLSENGLLVGAGTASGARIVLMERTTGKLEDIRAGNRPVVMPGGRQYFFFRSSAETGPRLYLADTSPLDGEARQVAATEGPLGSYTQVIPISEDEVVFNLTDDGGEAPPYRFNLQTNELTMLPFTRKCTAYAWRSVTQQLICGVDGTDEYYLVGLDGQRLSQVALPNGFPQFYIPEYDVLIMNVPRFQWFGSHKGERRDTWAVSLATGVRELLIRDGHAIRGGLVWEP